MISKNSIYQQYTKLSVCLCEFYLILLRSKMLILVMNPCSIWTLKEINVSMLDLLIIAQLLFSSSVTKCICFNGNMTPSNKEVEFQQTFVKSLNFDSFFKLTLYGLKKDFSVLKLKFRMKKLTFSIRMLATMVLF